MSNRPQFTVRDLLIWTTVLAVVIISLKLLIESEFFQSSSPVAELILLGPALSIFPAGMFGIFVVPLGMLVMIAATLSKYSRFYSSGVFLLVTVGCWAVAIAIDVPSNNTCVAMLLLMAVCSAACFAEARYRTPTDTPETVSNLHLFAPPIASLVIVVATSLFWGSVILIIQF